MADEVRELAVSYDHNPTETFRQQLLVAYNNYAVALAGAGQIDEGIEQLRHGLQLDEHDRHLRQNLASLLTRRAQALLERRKHREAQALLEEAVTYQDDQAESWALLGIVYYESQRSADAERSWVRALQLNPQLAGIPERLAQLRQERPVEQSFQKLSQVSFDIRYPEGLPDGVEHQLQDVLLDARREVGQDFGDYPSQKIIVLLYSPEQFRRLRQDAPEWVGGQYDGKMRLPLLTDPNGAEFRKIAWHEYTHVIVQELSQGRCPTWLNEGLAEYEGTRQAPSQYPRLHRALAAGLPLSLTRLHGHFMDIRDPKEAALAYEQSLSVVTYLIEHYGLWRVKRLLKALTETAPFEDAFFAEFHMRLPELEKRWMEWAQTSLGPSH